MKGLRFLLGIGLVAALGTATAHAQSQDHLKCYKVKDPAKFNAQVTLQALQAQFGLENCRLNGKAQFFCVPVSKTVTDQIDKTKTPLVSEAFPVPKLEEDRLCYKLKCPNVDIPPIGVVDQFGTRPISKFKPVFLCTPARKGVIEQPDECADDSVAPHCNGICRDPVQKCRPTGVPGECSCQDPPYPCNASAPMCNGDCPIAGDVCRPGADGMTCGCTSPPTACSGSAPACNGDCPAGSKCLRSKSGACDCFGNIGATCQNALAPACGGACPNPGQQCSHNAALGRCVCNFPHP